MLSGLASRAVAVVHVRETTIRPMSTVAVDKSVGGMRTLRADRRTISALAAYGTNWSFPDHECLINDLALTPHRFSGNVGLARCQAQLIHRRCG